MPSKLFSAAALFAGFSLFPVTYCAAQSYAAVATRFADAPVAAQITVHEATAVRETPGRWYVVADVVTLIRAPASLPPRVSFLADWPADSGKLKRKTVLLIAARPAAGEQLQLVGAPLPWSAEAEARVRAILADVAKPGAAGRIRGVASAFHSPGNLPGESESQIFLDSTDGRPASLSVTRRPGVEPAWSASFGDVVGDAPPPARDSLAWFRLACGLPATLPDKALADLDDTGRSATRADYAFVRSQLGACN